MSTHLGKISFLDLPDVNGSEIVVGGSGVANQIVTSQASGTGILSIGLAPNPVIPGTASMRLPVGTTSQRPTSPVAGDTRFNSTLGTSEIFTGTGWSQLQSKIVQTAQGTIPYITGNATLSATAAMTIADGFQIFSTTFTPLFATSTIIVRFAIYVGTSSNSVKICTVFAGSTNVGAGATSTNSNNVPFALPVQVLWQPGSTAPITISARVASTTNSTTWVNQGNANNTYGGALINDYSIMEIL